MAQGERRASALHTGWDVVIDPDDELRYRVFSVTDEQVHGFLLALVTGGAVDFRVLRRSAADPLEDEPAARRWPDGYTPV